MYKLTFFEPTLLLQGASPFVLRRWRVNSAFDPDPLLGGGTLAGFPEIAAIYQVYRVEHFRVRFEIAANEPSVPVNFSLIFRDSDPGLTIATYADAQNASEVSPTTGPNIIGQTTGSSVFRSSWYKIQPSSILGNPMAYYADNDYSAAVTTNPASLVYMAFILMSTGAGVNLTNGAEVTMFMEFTVRFFGHKNILQSNRTRHIRNVCDAIDNKDADKATKLSVNVDRPYMYNHTPPVIAEPLTVNSSSILDPPNAFDISDARWNDIKMLCRKELSRTKST